MRGDQIPFGARIIVVCDAFDSQRPYNKPIAVEEALAELCCRAGSQFDSRVVETFSAVVRARIAAPDLPVA